MQNIFNASIDEILTKIIRTIILYVVRRLWIRFALECPSYGQSSASPLVVCFPKWTQSSSSFYPPIACFPPSSVLIRCASGFWRQQQPESIVRFHERSVFCSHRRNGCKMGISGVLGLESVAWFPVHTNPRGWVTSPLFPRVFGAYPTRRVSKRDTDSGAQFDYFFRRKRCFLSSLSCFVASMLTPAMVFLTFLSEFFLYFLYFQNSSCIFFCVFLHVNSFMYISCVVIYGDDTLRIYTTKPFPTSVSQSAGLNKVVGVFPVIHFD